MNTTQNKYRPLLLVAPMVFLLSSCNFGLFKFGESGKSLLGRFIKKLPSAVVVEVSGEHQANECKSYTVALRNQDLLQIDLSEQEDFVPVVVESFMEESQSSSLFRTASECLNGSPTFSRLNLNIMPGSDQTSFYVRSQSAGSLRLGINSPSLQGFDYTGPIRGNLPRGIGVSGRQTPTAGQCVSQEIRILDNFGNIASKSGPLTLTLQRMSGAGRLYSKPPCLSADQLAITENITVPGNDTSYTVYYKSDSEGTTQVQYRGTGLSTQTVNYSVGAGLPVKLALTEEPSAAPSFAADDLKSGTCHRFRVEAQDFVNNPTNQSGGLTITFVTPADAVGKFYRTAGECNATSATNNGSSNTTVTIPEGQTSKDFYLRGIAPDSARLYRLVTTNGSGQELSVNTSKSFRPGDPNEFEITGGATSVTAGSCISSSFVVTLKDRWGNTTVAPRGMDVRISGQAASDRFFASNSCSGAGSANLTVSIPNMGNQTSFSFRTEQATLQQASTAKRRITVQETGTTLNDVGTPISPNSNTNTLLDVSPAPPSTIELIIDGAIASGRESKKAGESEEITVESRDMFGNLSNVSSTLSLGLTETDSASGTILYQSNCSTPATSISIPANSRSAPFCVKKTNVGNAPGADDFDVRVNATGPFTASKTAQFSYRPNTINQIEFVDGANVNSTAGNCFVKTLRAKDTHGNTTTDHSSKSISLSPNNSQVKFFSGTLCSGSTTTSVTFVANQSDRSIRIQPQDVPGGGPGTGSVNIAASISSPSSSDNFTLTFGPGPLDSISIADASGPTTLSLEGDCGRFSVSSKDEYGNDRNWGLSSLNILNSNSAVELFPTTCGSGGSLSSLPVTSSASSSTFHVRGKKVGTRSFTLAGAGVNSSGKTIVVKREDFDFEGNGVAIDDLGSVDRANAVIGLAGNNFMTAGLSNSQFTVTRYTQNGGNFDATPTRINLSAGVEEALAIARFNATYAVVVGYGTEAGKQDTALAMVNVNTGVAEATLVRDYEGSGSFHDVAQAVTVQGGIIVTGGYVDGDSGRQLAISKFQFSGGTLTHLEDLAVSVSGEIKALAAYSDGSKYAGAGTDTNQYTTFVINSDFSITPIVRKKAGSGSANAVVLDGSNSIYTAGTIGGKPAVVKYNSAGTETASQTFTPNGSANGIVLLGSHAILAGNTVSGDKDFAIYRVNSSNLAEDPDFGGSSSMVRTTGVGSGNDEALGLAIVNNRFVAVGGSTNTSNHAVVRYRVE